MKPRTWIFWLGVIGLAAVIMLQCIAAIDRAHGRYSDADRVRIAEMRERVANDR